MQWLKADTQVVVRIGPFMDFEDGVTPETGITLGAADQAEITKHGGGASVDISSLTWAAVTGMDGWYDLTLTSSETNTEGMLEVVVQDASVCLPVCAKFMVVAGQVYDSMVPGSDYLDTQVSGMDANVVTAAAIAAAAIDNATFAADVGSTAYATNIMALAVRKALDEIKLDHLGAVADADDAVDDSWIAKLAAVGGDWSTFVPADDSLQAISEGADTGLTTVEGKIDTIDTNVDTLVTRITSTIFAGITSLAEWLGAMMGSQAADATALTEIAATGAGSGTYDEAQESLEAIRARGDSTWAGSPPTIMQSTTIATLASQTSFTLAAGSSDDDAYNDAYGIVVDQTTGAQQCICDITDYTGATKTVTLGSDPGIFTMATGDTIYIIAAAPGTAAPTAAQNRAEMDSNSTQLAAIVLDTGTTLDGKIDTISTNVDAVLVDTGTTIPGTITTVDANVDAILVDTGTTLPGTLTTMEGKIDTVDTNVDAVLVDTGTTIPGTIATVDANVDSILADTGTDGVLLAAAATSAQLVDDIWDEAQAGHTTGGTVGESLDNAGGSALSSYMPWGSSAQDSAGDITWEAYLLKNGAPYTSVTNCTVALDKSDGDNTWTAVSGATETVATPDAYGYFNGTLAGVTLAAGVVYRLRVSITADSAARLGKIPIIAPGRTS